MSVATEFAPEVRIPLRARSARPPERLAAVTVLHRPDAATVAPPLRLTRRGVVVVGVLVAVVGALMLLLAWVSAPPAASPAAGWPAPAVVTVRPGDSLWSIATRVAPDTDPQAEIDRLVRLNGLRGVTVVPGQLVRTR